MCNYIYMYICIISNPHSNHANRNITALYICEAGGAKK